MSMLSALKTISLLADGEDPESIERGFVKAEPGEVAIAFREFEVCIATYMHGLCFSNGELVFGVRMRWSKVSSYRHS